MPYMRSFTRLQEESNQIGIEFLLTELDTAFTFLDVAQTTASAHTRERNQKHACEAYDMARRMQARVVMEPTQRDAFKDKLSLLKKRLEDLGHNVD